MATDRARFLARAALVVAVFASAGAATSMMLPAREAASRAARCDGSSPERAAAQQRARQGRALVAAVGRRVVAPGMRGTPCVIGRDGVLRHVATRAGVGSAVVEDTPGSDRVVVIGEEGTRTVEVSGEVTHPTWSPRGRLAWTVNMRAVEVATRSGAVTARIPRPRGTRAVFSPVFRSESRVASVVQEDVPEPFAAEDDFLDNLWSFDLRARRWTPLTDFRLQGTRWSIIRTPVVASDGSILFVRVTGDALATRAPSFELWRLRERGAVKVRSLPGEMYIASVQGRGIVWNVPSPRCDGWALVRRSFGGVREIGCGAVTADPVQPDPDLVVDVTHEAEQEPSADAGDGERTGVLVGDFSSRAAARAVATRAKVGLRASVVDHDAQPLSVRPGAWAVVWRLPSGTRAGEALATVRRALPRYRDRAWIVPLE